MTHTHTHTCTHIYSHPQTDCFVLSELFSVARHVGRSKPVSKPIQLYVRLSLRPLGQQEYHVREFLRYSCSNSSSVRLFTFLCPIGYQSAQFFRRAFHYANDGRQFLRQRAQCVCMCVCVCVCVCEISRKYVKYMPLYIYIYILQHEYHYIYIYSGTRVVMVIVKENGHGTLSSKPGWGCLHCANTFQKDTHLVILAPQLWQIKL